MRTPYLERYGVPSFWTSIIWLSGPISGLLVSPIVGYLSDTTTSILGPRRPWILFGLVLLASADIFLASGDSLYGSYAATVASALVMFVLSDVAVNVIQTPLRALNSDVSPPSMQFAVQLFLVVFQGLGQMLAFQIQAMLGKENYFLFFVVVVALSVLMTLPLCIYVTERRLKQPKSTQVGICEPLKDIVKSVTYIDAKMFKLGMVNIFSWFALFAFLPLGSTYMAVSVYGGCPSVDIDGCTAEGVDKYNEGILDYARTGVIGNAVQIICAILLSAWMFKSPSCRLVKAVYAAGLLVGAATGAAANFFPRSPIVGELVVIVMNVPNTIMRAFPFAILANYENGADGVSIATKFGVLNLFIVIPQIFVTFAVSSIRSALGDEEGLLWVMMLASASFFLSAVSCYFIENYDVGIARRIVRTRSMGSPVIYSASAYALLPKPSEGDEDSLDGEESSEEC